MKKSEWSDRELEELLRQMPRIQDHRDPHDIYQNISLKKKKTRPWLLPGFAAAACFLLLFILVPKLMGGINFSYQSSEEEKSSSAGRTTAKDSSASSKKETEASEAKQADLLNTENVNTAVYEDEIGNNTVFTYWIPDAQAQILIPVSIIVPQTSGPFWITQYTDIMANLQEEEWGLSDFYPINANFSLDKSQNTVIVDLPSNHSYGLGSTAETNFLNILNKDISSNSNYKKIKFMTNGQPGIEFGNFGRMDELDIIPETNHGYFFYYAEGSDLPFLTPSDDTFNDISSAINAMKAEQPMGLKSSLQSLPPINNVSISNKIMYVSFEEGSIIEDNQQSILCIEAMLLTAKEFGAEKMIIKNASLTNIGRFDLSNEIKVPIAPNLRKIP